MTKSNPWIQGIYRDVVEDAERSLVYDSGWVSNTITTDCRVLLASFIGNDATANGIRYLAVGQGEEDWEGGGTTSPDPDTDITLKQPYDPPLDVIEVAYLDAAGQVQEPGTRTQRIMIKVTLGAGYPEPLPDLETYPLREFGLFGELGGVPYMLNNVRHPTIDKHKSETLIREVRLSF